MSDVLFNETSNYHEDKHSKNNKTDLLIDIVQSLVETIQQVMSTMEDLSFSAQQLTSEMESLDLLQKDMVGMVNKTEAMLNFINKVAKNSNLLGLNASIEAARAGQQGKGFEVVANEIRKMAENSTKRVQEIQGIIESLRLKMDLITKTTGKVASVTQHQAAATQEVTASMEEMSTCARQLEDVARSL